MLIDLKTINRKYRPNITGILHVGAHLAEESRDYTNAGVKNVVWVEGNSELYEKLLTIVPNDLVINAVVGDVAGKEVTFHRANNGQSSSVLELGTHKTAHPEVHYISSETKYSERLDDLYKEWSLHDLNFLNLDIQGAELMALKGLGDRLSEFGFIYTEVNREELYVGCCLVEDLDEYLSDFDRVETVWTEFGWGDAFYVRVR